MRGALQCNDYPEWILKELENGDTVNSEKQTPGKKEDTHTEKRKFLVVNPYIKGYSEEVTRVFGKYKIPTYFKPTNTLRQLLVKPKDPVDKENVYRMYTEYNASCVKQATLGRQRGH